MDVYEFNHVRKPNASAHCHSIQAVALYVQTDGKKVEGRKDGLVNKYAPSMEI